VNENLVHEGIERGQSPGIAPARQGERLRKAECRRLIAKVVES
jgi:hypothetical protein